MTPRLLIAALSLAAFSAAGCGSSENAAGAANAPDASSPLPKAPKATAADNASRLKNANMSEDAKRVLGAGKPGGS